MNFNRSHAVQQWPIGKTKNPVPFDGNNMGIPFYSLIVTVLFYLDPTF